MAGGEACGGRTSSKGGRAGVVPEPLSPLSFLDWASAWLPSLEAQHRSKHGCMWGLSSAVPYSAELLGQALTVSASSLLCPLPSCPGYPTLRLLATWCQGDEGRHASLEPSSLTWPFFPRQDFLEQGPIGALGGPLGSIFFNPQ